MTNTPSCLARLLCGITVSALVVLTSLQPASAQPSTNCDQAGVACEPPDGEAAPPAGTGGVGTAVHVVIHKSFTETEDTDQCVGASALATVRRGSSVVLSESSFMSSEPRKVAVGQFFRSRMNDGKCEVLYITSAPVMSAFAVQFAGPAGDLSATYGPINSEPVTDQPGIQQVVIIHMEFEPQL